MRLLVACVAFGVVACARPAGPGEVTPRRWADTVRSVTGEFTRMPVAPPPEQCRGALNKIEATEDVFLRAPDEELQRRAPFVLEAMQDYYVVCVSGHRDMAERYREAARLVDDYVAEATRRGHTILR